MFQITATCHVTSTDIVTSYTNKKLYIFRHRKHSNTHNVILPKLMSPIYYLPDSLWKERIRNTAEEMKVKLI